MNRQLALCCCQRHDSNKEALTVILPVILRVSRARCPQAVQNKAHHYCSARALILRLSPPLPTGLVHGQMNEPSSAFTSLTRHRHRNQAGRKVTSRLLWQTSCNKSTSYRWKGFLVHPFKIRRQGRMTRRFVAFTRQLSERREISFSTHLVVSSFVHSLCCHNCFDK